MASETNRLAPLAAYLGMWQKEFSASVENRILLDLITIDRCNVTYETCTSHTKPQFRRDFSSHPHLIATGSPASFLLGPNYD